MELLHLHNKINQLPPEYQIELLHFSEFLLMKSNELHKTTKSEKNKREFGCMQGLIISISDDFDAPLDDFE